MLHKGHHQDSNGSENNTQTLASGELAPPILCALASFAGDDEQTSPPGNATPSGLSVQASGALNPSAQLLPLTGNDERTSPSTGACKWLISSSKFGKMGSDTLLAPLEPTFESAHGTNDKAG